MVARRLHPPSRENVRHATQDQRNKGDNHASTKAQSVVKFDIRHFNAYGGNGVSPHEVTTHLTGLCMEVCSMSRHLRFLVEVGGPTPLCSSWRKPASVISSSKCKLSALVKRDYIKKRLHSRKSVRRRKTAHSQGQLTGSNSHAVTAPKLLRASNSSKTILDNSIKPVNTLI